MNGIFVPVIFMRLLKNANTAILLGQIYYWNRPTKEGHVKLTVREYDADNKIIYLLVKQYSELTAETGIEERTLRRCLETLKTMGIITVSVRHSPFHSGEQALFIYLDLHTLIQKLIELDGTVLSHPDKLSDSETDKLSDSLSETTSETTDVAPKPARYGGLLATPTVLDRNSWVMGESDEKDKVAFDSGEMPPVGLDLLNIVLKHNPKAKKELSRKQIEQLKRPVATLKGEKPSPDEMQRRNGFQWDRFIANLENMPAWKKRVIENKEKVTPGLVLQFFRGYEWIGGLLSNAPDERKSAPMTSEFFEDT